MSPHPMDPPVATAAAAPQPLAAPPSQAVAPEASSMGQPWPSPSKAWYSVGVFALMLLVVFMNNGVVSLLVDMIKRDLHLTDTQVSLIIGFSAIFAAVLSLPISRLIDTVSRKLIIGVGLLVGGVSTLASGLSHTFTQLFVSGCRRSPSRSRARCTRGRSSS